MIMSNSKRLKMGYEDASCSSTIKEETLKPNFNPFTSDFGEAVEMNCYVDKSLLIRTILDNPTTSIVITAPRRFGKSTNMDMIKKFIEIQVDRNGIVIEKEKSPNRKIFEYKKLSICEDKEFFDNYFATYPVIHSNFKGIGANSYERVLDGFRSVLWETFSEHAYLFESHIWSQRKDVDIDEFHNYCNSKECRTLNEEQIKVGLQFLSKCLCYHFNKPVFVLIDEYDAPINKAMFDKEIDINRINALLSAIFSAILKDNEFVKRGFLTGISYFATAGLSGVNNIEKYMFLGNHPFVKYYGLIESEVDALLSKFKIDDEEREVVKLYYDDYNSRGNVKLFSLWSVLHYLQKKELEPYWQMSGIIYGLKKALRIPLIQFAVEKMLQGNYTTDMEIFDTITLDDMVELQKIVLGRPDKNICNPDKFLNFLLQQGYLTYTSTENQKNSIKIPNKKMCDEYRKELHVFYGNCSDRVLKECTTAFGQISVSDRTRSFQKFFETFQNVVHSVQRSIIKDNERIFHSLLFCVIFRGEFKCCDDAEFFGSRSRSDLIVVKGKVGFMFEIKFKEDSETALQQIIKKQYYIAFHEDIFKNLEHKLYVGINVSEDLCVSLAVLDANNFDINKAEYFPKK